MSRPTYRKKPRKPFSMRLTGTRPPVPVALVAATDPFAHPDAQRRFRVMQNVEELERALDYPWEKLVGFLSPGATGDCRTPVWWACSRGRDGRHRQDGGRPTSRRPPCSPESGSPGPPHHLLGDAGPDAPAQLSRLTAGEPALAGRITVEPVDDAGFTLYEQSFGTPRRATEGMIKAALAELSRVVGGHAFSDSFLLNEWTQVVDAWRLTTWEAYRDVARLGRKTRLGRSSAPFSGKSSPGCTPGSTRQRSSHPR